MKSWIWSDSLWQTENLCCSKEWIVLNSELKTSVIVTNENFFQMDSSSWSNGWIFFWTDNPSCANGIPNDLEYVTNSSQTIFSCSYVFVWKVIKKEIKNLRFTDEDLIVYSRMNNVTVSTWCDRSTWPVSEVFGWSSHHFGQILSVDWPLFWALYSQEISQDITKSVCKLSIPSIHPALDTCSHCGPIFILWNKKTCWVYNKTGLFW